MLADRTNRIAVSPTMKVAAEAMRLKAQGVDVVDFGAGEPDFPTPQHIGAAAHAAIDANFTKYTTNSGTDELKRAVVRALPDRLRRRVHDQRGDHHRRRQAGALQRRDVPVRAGRRGHHAHARLADAGRADQARRRHAGDRAHARGGRVPPARRADPRGDHAAHARHHHQLAGQPDRRADRRRPRWPRSPTRRARGIWILLDLCYEKLIYDTDAAQSAGRAGRADARSHGALRLGVEGVRDDRLALRLGGRRRRRSSPRATRCRATRRRTSARSRRRRSPRR